MLKQPKILEINPEHPIIIEINERISNDDNDSNSIELTHLLYETSALRSGYSIDNTEIFSERIFNMMKKGLQNLKKGKKEEQKDEL
jgi:HSP90 family molecular chaperone